jgi:hypothetical protein
MGIIKVVFDLIGGVWPCIRYYSGGDPAWMGGLDRDRSACDPGFDILLPLGNACLRIMRAA